MKKIFISIGVVMVVLVGIIVGALLVQKKASAPVVATVPLTETPQPIKLCFYGETKTKSGLVDVSLVTMRLLGDSVSGEFQTLPAEKDSKVGSFSGTVSAVDKKSMARTIDAIWNTSGEGMQAQEQLKVVFGEGTAEAGFGEMVDNEKGIYVYKDPAKITYGQIMTDVDCNDVKIIEHTNGHMCYAYHQPATSSAPYAVDETLTIDANNALISGTKKGTQNGPDMTNGYTGAISGKRVGDTINVLFSYTIEGSKNVEQEFYKYVSGGLEKMRYPLVQKKGILVPDTTKPFKKLEYLATDCISAVSVGGK